MPNLDPSKINKLMKQMGMKTETIDAVEVVIKTKGGKVLVRDPSVTKIDMKGQEILQVQGEIVEGKQGEAEEEQKTDFDEEDVKTVMEQTGASEEDARAALEEEDDLAMAIMRLKK